MVPVRCYLELFDGRRYDVLYVEVPCMPLPLLTCQTGKTEATKNGSLPEQFIMVRDM